MGGQFHDILPGTSHPEAYEYSWNDEILALNQFADVLDNAVGYIAAGQAGYRIELANTIDWHSRECSLKAVFPLAVTNPKPTYNWEVGTIERGNNDPKKYAVPAHQWFDLTDAKGDYGVTVLSDCKYGSDKPDDQTLRLTLLRTPGVHGEYQDQGTQDWGRHEILYGLAGHVGDWRQGQTDWQALRLNQPPIAFQTAPHDGTLSPSMLASSSW
jgi:alpha-mannosidase